MSPEELDSYESIRNRMISHIHKCPICGVSYLCECTTFKNCLKIYCDKCAEENGVHIVKDDEVEKALVG